jgi:membrane protease YdiL (CAAX protease family)
MLTQVRPKLRPAYSRAGAYFLGYAGWNLAIHLLTLTLITYFLMSAHGRFQDISDAYGSNEIVLIGFSALGYILFLIGLNPLIATSAEEVVSAERMDSRFGPGFVRGAVVAVAVTLAFLLSGLYRYLGFFVQFVEAPMAIGAILLRVLALGIMVYCEEFIFRHKILNALRRDMPELAAALITALLYSTVKAVQFDIGWMHMITLFLVSMTLAIRAISDGDFTRGAGYWAGMLIVFHPLLSLPIFGNDFQGILLVKYRPDLSNFASSGTTTARILTGGFGGPLSSIALQLLLLIDIGQGIARHKRILLK